MRLRGLVAAIVFGIALSVGVQALAGEAIYKRLNGAFHLVMLSGEINAKMAVMFDRHVQGFEKRAKRGEEKNIAIGLDTISGDDDSTREIVRGLLSLRAQGYYVRGMVRRDAECGAQCVVILSAMDDVSDQSF
ncbi:hypothetical protein [Rhizobium sp. R86522]|uniref:hypothetical protein n=1 Tax=Rhizobium sp. R86522 TaxID=3093861 RepID=UPI003671077B